MQKVDSHNHHADHSVVYSTCALFVAFWVKMFKVMHDYIEKKLHFNSVRHKQTKIRLCKKGHSDVHGHNVIFVTHFSRLNVTAGWGHWGVYCWVTVTKLDSHWHSCFLGDAPADCEAPPPAMTVCLCVKHHVKLNSLAHFPTLSGDWSVIQCLFVFSRCQHSHCGHHAIDHAVKSPCEAICSQRREHVLHPVGLPEAPRPPLRGTGTTHPTQPRCVESSAAYRLPTLIIVIP